MFLLVANIENVLLIMNIQTTKRVLITFIKILALEKNVIYLQFEHLDTILQYVCVRMEHAEMLFIIKI